MAVSDVIYINPTVGKVRNGIVVIQPTGAGANLAGALGEGSGGYVLSHREPGGDPQREQTFANLDFIVTPGLNQQGLGGKYININYYTEGLGSIYASTNDYASGSNIVPTITYPAVGSQSHSFEGVSYGYSAAPPVGARIDIRDSNGTKLFGAPITAAGITNVDFGEDGRRANPGASVTVTMGSGGAGVIGEVNMLGHRLN